MCRLKSIVSVFAISSVLSVFLFSMSVFAQKTKDVGRNVSKDGQWRTITLERLNELSDTSSPMFRDGKTGHVIVLRCQDEGWGNVSLERVRGRFALDHELGLKSWPEIEKALKEQKEAYLKSNRLRAREIFVMDDSGPKHPRDDLAKFGEAEQGFRYKFGKFDECSKVDSDSMKPGEVCQVVLEVKDGAKKSGASGFARFKSVSCRPQTESSDTAPGAANSPAVPGQGKQKQPVAR